MNKNKVANIADYRKKKEDKKSTSKPVLYITKITDVATRSKLGYAMVALHLNVRTSDKLNFITRKPSFISRLLRKSPMRKLLRRAEEIYPSKNSVCSNSTYSRLETTLTIIHRAYYKALSLSKRRRYATSEMVFLCNESTPAELALFADPNLYFVVTYEAGSKDVYSDDTLKRIFAIDIICENTDENISKIQRIINTFSNDKTIIELPISSRLEKGIKWIK